MNVTMVLLLFAAVLIIDGRGIWKEAPRGVKIAYVALMLPSFVVMLLYGLNIPLPAPGSAITRALKEIFSFVS